VKGESMNTYDITEMKTSSEWREMLKNDYNVVEGKIIRLYKIEDKKWTALDDNVVDDDWVTFQHAFDILTNFCLHKESI
jgi:hypothetical protein